MADVRLTRQAIEVFAKIPPRAAVPRQETEALVEDEGGAGNVRLTRQAVEVFAEIPDRVNVPRQEVEALVEDEGTTANVRLTRQAIEAFVARPAIVNVPRQEVEAVVEDEGTSGAVRLTRQAAEVFSRAPLPPVAPRPLPATFELFSNNWAKEVTIETGYTTDVTSSPSTGAEERRALLQRPTRNMRFELLLEGVDDIDRLLVTLRDMTDEQTVWTLFPDLSVVRTTSPTPGNSIFCQCSFRRFFKGARIAVIPIDGKRRHDETEVHILTVNATFPDRIDTVETLPVTFQANQWVVYPLLDVEVTLRPIVVHETDKIVSVVGKIDEVYGRNSLPPATSGFPDGFQRQLGLPVFHLEPNWVQGIETTYVRQGSRQRRGRKEVIFKKETRFRQLQKLDLLFKNREEAWRMIEFFDSRRGRRSAFWMVDQERVWAPALIDPTFIEIVPQGKFADFEKNFEHIGIVEKDGTTTVRKVNTIQDLGTTWRITVAAGNPVPSIALTNIQRISRARTCRFEKDALRMVWFNSAVAQTTVSIIETLAEKEVTLT